ncbi:MAG: hypothetical protein ABSF15_28125 [Candidatus Sulfotelmatobacter sp.]
MISRRLLRQLDEALAARQVEHGLGLLQKHGFAIRAISPRQANAASFVDCLARWIDMDFTLLEQVKRLLRKFSRDIRANLPMSDCLRLRLASGIVEMHAGRVDKAIDDLLYVLSSDKEIDDKNVLMIANYCMGRCYRNKGEYGKSGQYALAAAALASGKSLQKQRAVIQVLESWILFQQGKSAEALRLLRNAELQLKVTDDHVSMGNIYSFRARMARREGRREDALVLWEQAVAAYQQRPASVGHPNMARALSYMAHVELLKAHALQRGADKLRVSAHAGGPGKRRKELIEKERHDSIKRAQELRKKALIELDIAKAIYSKVGNRRGLGTCLLRYAFSYLDAGQFHEALASATDAYDLGDDTDVLLMARSRIVQCMIEGEMCESEIDTEPRVHADRARRYAAQAIDYSARTQNVELQARSHLAMGFALLNAPSNATEAASSHERAAALIKEARLYYLSEELEELWKRISDTTPLEGPLRKWLLAPHGQSLDDLQKHIYRLVWRYEKKSIKGVVRNLHVSRKKARSDLSKYGLSTPAEPAKRASRKETKASQKQSESNSARAE